MKRWRIVVRGRRSGHETIVATGGAGGILSAQFALDGDVLVWAQPTPKGPIDLTALNLATRARWVLASAAGYNSIYDFVRADHGYVVWEWDHLVEGKPVSDILGEPERGGVPRRITSGHGGSRPAISWPQVSYVRGYRFGNSHEIVVYNLQSRRTWSILVHSEPYTPELGDGIMLYELTGAAYLVAVDTRSHSRVVLTRASEVTIDGAFMAHFYAAGEFIGAVSQPIKLTDNEQNTNRFVLALFDLHGASPVSRLISCS